VLAAGQLASLLGVFDWSMIFITIGVISIALALFSLFFVVNRPEDLGFQPVNQYAATPAAELAGGWWKKLYQVVRTPKILPGFWVQFGLVGSLYAFMGLWGVRYLQDVRLMDMGVAARHMTLMLLSFAAGALFFGWLSDRVGRRKPVIVFCTLGYCASWILLMYGSWSTGPGSYLLLGTMGLMGSGFAVTFAAAKEVAHPDLSGMGVSVVNTGCFIGTAIMQPLFGRIVDMTWDGTISNNVRVYGAADYHNGFTVILAFALIAASLFPLAKPVQEMVMPEVGRTPIRKSPTAQRPYFSSSPEKNIFPIA
jgi:sugar phosphate permease